MTKRPMRAAEPADEAGADSPRAEFLRKQAQGLGAGWATEIRDALRREHRRFQGGFPGTLGEVRRQVAGDLPRVLALASMPALSSTEREWSTRVAYAAAKADWNRHSERDGD